MPDSFPAAPPSAAWPPEPAPPAPAPRPGALAGQAAIYFYIGLLISLSIVIAPNGGGLPYIPIQYFLKNQLHSTPSQQAAFITLTGVPLYLGFFFGLLRDRWKPFGLGDRGYLLLAAPLLTAVFVWLARGRVTYSHLVVGVIAGLMLSQLIGTAAQGLLASVGQRLAMTGRLSTLYNVMTSVVGFLVPVAGGWLAARASMSALFYVAAGASLAVLVLAAWRPASVFSGETQVEQRAAPPESLWRGVARLARHRAIYPAVAVWLIWSVSFMSGTPTLFYLTSRIHLTQQQYGFYLGTFAASFLPTMLLYGAVCRRFALSRLLVWGTAFAVLQNLALLIMHSFPLAIASAGLQGLLGGFATAAYYDLIVRSCPARLEGTTMALALSGQWVATNFSNQAGSWLYTHGGYALGVWATLGVYCLIAPLLLLAPRELTAVKEGDVAGLHAAEADGAPALAG